MRFSTRRLVAYALCALIFAGAVLAAVKLSFPHDASAGRADVHVRRSPAPVVEAENDTLTIKQGKQTQKYRFYETPRGVVAEQVEED